MPLSVVGVFLRSLSTTPHIINPALDSSTVVYYTPCPSSTPRAGTTVVENSTSLIFSCFSRFLFFVHHLMLIGMSRFFACVRVCSCPVTTSLKHLPLNAKCDLTLTRTNMITSTIITKNNNGRGRCYSVIRLTKQKKSTCKKHFHVTRIVRPLFSIFVFSLSISIA